MKKEPLLKIETVPISSFAHFVVVTAFLAAKRDLGSKSALYLTEVQIPSKLSFSDVTSLLFQVFK